MHDHADGIARDLDLVRLDAVLLGHSAVSSSLILRLALAMSVVPLISAAMPVPEPPPETEMRTSGLTF